MAKNQIKKYVWLVETIYKAKKISLKEINSKWLEIDLSEGLEIPRRTFHTWRNEVEDLFGIEIQCDKTDGDRYFIEDRDKLKNNSLQSWLLNTMSVNNMLLENKTLSDRILLENIPSGQDYLSIVTDAMKKSKVLEITYKGYWSEHEHTFPVAPYCVKLFRQRWYMVGYSVKEKIIRIYSLDRVFGAQMIDKSFKYPDDFSPEVFFEGCFGIIHGVDCPMETVKLRVSAHQANYLRSLPLHASQKELVRTGEYSIFSVEVRPTFDFQQELLWNGDAVEVLEPLWLRDDMAEIVKRMWNNYEKKA